MKTVYNILALTLAASCLAGCNANIPGSPVSQPAVQPAQTHETEAPTGPLPTVRYETEDKEIPIGKSFLAHGIFLQSGTLNYTVTGARVLGPDSEATLSIDQFFPYTFVPNVETGKYPDFLDENGHLSPGCYLVQVDITVENVDAQAIEEEYGDPCLFRADDLFLVKLDASPGTIDGHRVAGYRNVDFFSLAGEYDAHPMLYRLEPGNTVSYTIGFLADETWAVDGASSLRLSQSSDQSCLKVDLRLGGDSHE